MFLLLMIVALGVLALWLSNSEKKHPAVLVIVGILSIGLGGRAAALLSDAYSTTQFNVVYADEEAPSLNLPHETVGDGSVASAEAEITANADIIYDTAITEDEATVQTAKLSVEPKPSFIYLTLPRPDWVETEPSTSDERFQVAVESGLHVQKRKAQQVLQEEVTATLNRYINDYLGSEFASTLVNCSISEGERDGNRTINLRLAGKSFQIAEDRFDEQVEFDYGVMNQSHALIKLDKQVQNALDARWSEVRATSRLFQTGLGGGALLLLLATMFGYLKLDTATRGYYTGRLQFGAAAAILAIVAAGAVFAKLISWM